MKKVRAVDDIVFESEEIPLLPKGSIYEIGAVVGGGIILRDSKGEEFVIDLNTFEAGFEIAEV